MMNSCPDSGRCIETECLLIEPARTLLTNPGRPGYAPAEHGRACARIEYSWEGLSTNSELGCAAGSMKVWKGIADEAVGHNRPDRGLLRRTGRRTEEMKALANEVIREVETVEDGPSK